MESDSIGYPNRLRECIKASGYKIQEFAQETKIPLRTLYDYFKGMVPIPRERLETMADALGYPVNYLVTPHPVRNQLPDSMPSTWSVPHQRNPFFTGRESLLKHLHELLNTNATVALTHPQAISGLGGVGKTQIALEYAYRYHQEYETVLWVKADSRENLVADLIGIARLLHLPEQDMEDQMVAVMAVIQWFKTHSHWLLIFDNADDLAIIQPFLPPAFGGHVILTTRAQAMRGSAQRIDVECMTPEVGALFLLRRVGIVAPTASLEQASIQDRTLAFQLIEELGGLPLAIDQAGAYMEEASYHLAGYLKLYHRQQGTLLKRRGGLATDHPAPVATTWALSFERVEQADPMAADILRLCAFLDPDAIPEEIFLEGAYEPGTSSASTPLDQLRVNEAIEVLLRFSLVQRNAEAGTLTIHRLVQAVIQDTMDKEMQRLWAERTVRAVNRAFPETSNVYSASGYPHRAVQLLKVSMYVDQERGNKEKLATTLWNLAVQQQVLGRLSASEQALRDSITLCREIHDTFNEAKAHQYFALLRAYQGMFKEVWQHLDIALSLLKELDVTSSEGVVWAYHALCALLAEDIPLALAAAKNARRLADIEHNDRDIIRSEWLLSWVSVRQACQESQRPAELLEEAELHLKDALDRCHHMNLVDYEADLLLAWARLYHVKGDKHQARIYATEALVITNRSAFRLLRADVHNLFAQLEMEDGNWQAAKDHAQAALADARCDGPPYCYAPALEKAKGLLAQIEHYYLMEISHS